MWAPSMAMDWIVSLGYFMMPISMVIVGHQHLKSECHAFSNCPAIFAVLGILNLLAISQTLSWPTLLICLGYRSIFGSDKKQTVI